MKEDFLHYVWKHQLFDRSDLRTSSGLPVRIEDAGDLNDDSGPDFFRGRVWIGDVKWSGPIEIHVDGKDWYRHKHHLDLNYEVVILHVVYKNPVEVHRKNKSEIPTIVLEERISEQTLLKYHGFEPLERVLCRNGIQNLKINEVLKVVQQSNEKRVLRKAHALLSVLPQVDFDWNELTYRTLGENLGFKINSIGFKALVETVPYKIISKHHGETKNIEAILLGAAGFLDYSREPYAKELQQRFMFLSSKYRIGKVPLHQVNWNTVKVRAGAYPTLRIAQLASLLSNLPKLFTDLVGTTSVENLRERLNVAGSQYWQSHYHFGCMAESRQVRLGKSSIDKIIINTVVPLRMAWSTYNGSPDSLHVELLRSLPYENNSIIRYWKTLGVSPGSALESQGLIELYNTGCSKRKCLDCGIGQQVLNR